MDTRRASKGLYVLSMYWCKWQYVNHKQDSLVDKKITRWENLIRRAEETPNNEYMEDSLARSRQMGNLIRRIA